MISDGTIIAGIGHLRPISNTFDEDYSKKLESVNQAEIYFYLSNGLAFWDSLHEIGLIKLLH
jgi:hypothetical protein